MAASRSVSKNQISQCILPTVSPTAQGCTRYTSLEMSTPSLVVHYRRGKEADTHTHTELLSDSVELCQVLKRDS